MTKAGHGPTGGKPITYSFYAQSFSADPREPNATGGGSVLTRAQEMTISTALLASRDYCARRVGPPPPRLRQAVARLLALEMSDPTGVARNPVVAGQSVRQITADIGGLLNTHCAPALGAEVARVLAP